METKKYMCGDHPTKQLIFVCVPCGNLICSRCKKADHEGHKTKDIVKFAEEVRRTSTDDSKQIQSRIADRSSLLRKQEDRKVDFDLTVDHTKAAIRERGELIIEWTRKHVVKKVASVSSFAAQSGRRQLARDIKETKKELKALNSQTEATARILSGNASDHEVARLSS